VITTDTSRQSCPYCGEMIELVIDCSLGEQSYIEDCSVCCRPITVTAYCDENFELLSVNLGHENE